MAGKPQKWSREIVEQAARDCPKIGREKVAAGLGVTPSGLDNAFARFGLATPKRYEQGFVAPPAEPGAAEMPAAGAPIDGLDWDDEGETRAQATRIVDAPAQAEATSPPTPPADRTYIDMPPASLRDVVLDHGELERMLIVPDVHWPFADRRAWDVMIATGRSFRPHTIVTLGDFVDAFTVSEHDRDPRRLTQLETELEYGRAGLDELQSLGAQRHVFIEGNHCYRLQRYLMRHAPALLDSVSIRGMLGLDARGWHHVRYMDHLRIGALHLTHDCGHAGVYAVQHTGAAFESNVAFGHTHRLSVNYTGSVRGERHVAASLGWLGDAREARYLPEAKKRAWQLGFGLAHFEPSGTVHLQAVPIVDYRACLHGALVTAA